jgi:hypothetical protein
MKRVQYLFLLTISAAVVSCKKDEVSPSKALSDSTWRLADYTIEARAINSSKSQIQSVFRPCYGLDQYTLAGDGQVKWTQLEGTCTYGQNRTQRSENEEVGTWYLHDNNTRLQIKSTWGWVAWEMGYDHESSTFDESHITMARQYKSFNQDTLYTRKITFERVK